MRINFPTNFFWGAATSATQSEGTVEGDGKGENIWDYASKKFNNRFYQGITPKSTSRFYLDYRDDIERMAQIRLNSFRTSISWSRLIPKLDGQINTKAVTFYHDVFTRMKAKGIRVFIDLYHFDMPMYLQEIGGFENKEVIKAYKNYAAQCFRLFGNDVDYWFTFNEPMIPAEAGYLHDRHYPFVVDFKRAAQVLHNIIVAHCEAVKEYRHLHLNSQIGIILDVIPVYSRSSNKADLQAAKMADLFYTKSLNDAILKGKYPTELGEILREYKQYPNDVSQDELELIADTKIDILGINYYKPRRVKARESAPNTLGVFSPEWFFDNYEMPGRRMNESRGIEIYPKGIYDIAMKIKQEYHNIPWFVSENGIGVEKEEQYIVNGMVQDDYRINFLKEHLMYLQKAIKEGSNCLGYHMWTFVDCWSWMNAYKNRYGFYRLDLETGEKSIKKSGIWFSNLIKTNGFYIKEENDHDAYI